MRGLRPPACACIVGVVFIGRAGGRRDQMSGPGLGSVLGPWEGCLGAGLLGELEGARRSPGHRSSPFPCATGGFAPVRAVMALPHWCKATRGTSGAIWTETRPGACCPVPIWSRNSRSGSSGWSFGRNGFPTGGARGRPFPRNRRGSRGVSLTTR